MLQVKVTKRKFDYDTKFRAVERIRGGAMGTTVANDLDVDPSVVNMWIRAVGNVQNMSEGGIRKMKKKCTNHAGRRSSSSM